MKQNAFLSWYSLLLNCFKQMKAPRQTQRLDAYNPSPRETEAERFTQAAVLLAIPCLSATALWNISSEGVLMKTKAAKTDNRKLDNDNVRP